LTRARLAPASTARSMSAWISGSVIGGTSVEQWMSGVAQHRAAAGAHTQCAAPRTGMAVPVNAEDAVVAFNETRGRCMSCVCQLLLRCASEPLLAALFDERWTRPPKARLFRHCAQAVRILAQRRDPPDKELSR
jgi:hypothetical protein